MEWTRPTAVDRLRPALRVDLMRQAVAAQPDSASLLLALGRALAGDEQHEEAVAVFHRAIAIDPDAGSFADLGYALMARGAHRDAIDAFSAAIGRAPANRYARAGHARALHRAGRHAEALAAAVALAADPPVAPEVLEFMTPALIEAGRAAELLSLLDRIVAADSGASEAWYSRAMALAAVGHRSEAAAIMDVRRIRVIEVPPPAEFPDFNEQLRDEILANQSLKYQPTGRAARKARRARALLAGNPPGLTRLAEIVREQSASYAEAFATADGPRLPPPPARAHLRMWATVFGSDGHEARHIHARSWLSAVYYVAAPPADVVRTGRGVLRVPVATDYAGAGGDWPVVDIEPRSGRLVMFPSYYPHSTVPTGSDDLRISVAFDVLPAPTDATAAVVAKI